MTRTTIAITAALLASCAAPTTREVCGTNPDGWQWCVTIQEHQP